MKKKINFFQQFMGKNKFKFKDRKLNNFNNLETKDKHFNNLEINK